MATPLIVLMRHGHRADSSVPPPEVPFTGEVNNTHLSPIGDLQARHVALALRAMQERHDNDLPWTVVCSPFRRTIQTATGVLKSGHIRVADADDGVKLHYHFGVCEHYDHKFAKGSPETIAAFTPDVAADIAGLSTREVRDLAPSVGPPAGVEPMRHAFARFERHFRDILDWHQTRNKLASSSDAAPQASAASNLLVVSHGFTFQPLLQQALWPNAVDVLRVATCGFVVCAPTAAGSNDDGGDERGSVEDPPAAATDGATNGDALEEEAAAAYPNFARRLPLRLVSEPGIHGIDYRSIVTEDATSPYARGAPPDVDPFEYSMRHADFTDRGVSRRQPFSYAVPGLALDC